MITTQIRDGNSNGNNFLKVNTEGEIGAVVHTHPPLKESITGLPFRQYFTLDGTPDGDNDMIVNGSSTAVDFCIPASPTEERFIKSLSIKLADATAKFNEFGALSALTNGVEFEWQSTELGSITIHDGIKDNIEWFRLSNAPITTASIIDLSGGGADAIVVQIDLAMLFGNPWGVRLVQETNEKLIFRVRDNLTGLDEFNIIGYGTKLQE